MTDSVFNIISSIQKTKRIADLYSRVAETSADIINNLVYLCKKNNVVIDNGTISLLEENEKLLIKITEIGYTNISYTQPTEFQQRNKTTDDETEPKLSIGANYAKDLLCCMIRKTVNLRHVSCELC